MIEPSRKQQAFEAASAPLRTQPSNYPEPFASQVSRREKRPLGDLFGLRNFGVNRTTILPGGVSALRHAHSKQDEFVYVLEGRLVLVTDEGESELTAGMCAGFAAGVASAHQFVNRTDLPATILEVGDRSAGDSVSYPHDDLQALLVDGRWQFRHKDGSPY